jgi:hypothetical protein
LLKTAVSVYELIKTFELDLIIEDDRLIFRVELFRSVASRDRFRIDIWEKDFYRIQSTFPQNELTFQPEQEPSDEEIFVDYSHAFPEEELNFQAASYEEAEERTLAICENFWKYLNIKENE